LASSNKTASLATAFGQTRLSASLDHVIMTDKLKETNRSPQTPSKAYGNIEQAIFEDDPMEN